MKKKYFLWLALCAVLALCLCACGGETQEQQGLEASDPIADSPLGATAEYLFGVLPELTPGDGGGDWIVIGLSRSDVDLPAGLLDDYYAKVEQYVIDCEGVLTTNKYTEYARTALVVTALGKDPQNVGGYDLLKPLGDFNATCTQGVNGAIWALIALNAAGVDAPVNEEAATQGTCDLYLQSILSAQLSDGGFALSGDVGDADMTAMALVALSLYADREDVSAAIENGLACLSSLQDENGGFGTFGEATCESSAQVLTALSALGISADDDRFVKNGNTVLDDLLTYALEDGSFTHLKSLGSSDQMATEQAFYAMVALERMENGDSALFDLSR
ncbi:MAG: terpene cyclase/mutase family protein [Firmicutes bacterium]|nr:terpene cyclase/mutase family protein [Bacillota bacterium]